MTPHQTTSERLRRELVGEYGVYAPPETSGAGLETLRTTQEPVTREPAPVFNREDPIDVLREHEYFQWQARNLLADAYQSIWDEPCPEAALRWVARHHTDTSTEILESLDELYTRREHLTLDRKTYEHLAEIGMAASRHAWDKHTRDRVSPRENASGLAGTEDQGEHAAREAITTACQARGCLFADFERAEATHTRQQLGTVTTTHPF